MEIVNLIQQKYGESCQLRSPLTKKQCDKAHKSLAEMRTQTDCYLGEYGSEGIVFAGTGAGGFLF